MPPSKTELDGGEGAGGPASTARQRARLLPWVLLVSGLLGTVSSFMLSVETFVLLSDPDHVPSCSINSVLSCGSIMSTPQAEVFGFPNPLIGIAGFVVVGTVGAMMVAGAEPGRWIWWGLQAGATFGVISAHWLIFESLFHVGALCPYCMVTWVATIMIFWHTTAATATRGLFGSSMVRVGRTMTLNHGIGVTSWLLGIAAVIMVRFFDYWSSLV